ncbi:MAG: hypothetical protein P8X64_14800 [Anaerolineales bacterium]|jgi:hypothetical protein
MKPFHASDTATIEFISPGLYEITLEVQDDDGGVSAVDVPKLITGNEFCSRSQGFWKHQFSGKGKPHFREDTLQRYLDLVSEASGYFGEVISLDNIESADRVMNPKGPDKLEKAEAQLLAAWLNFTDGSVAWDEIVQIEDGTTLSVGEALVQVESMLSDPHSTDADFVKALEIAESVNLQDEGNSSCD